MLYRVMGYWVPVMLIVGVGIWCGVNLWTSAASKNLPSTIAWLLLLILCAYSVNQCTNVRKKEPR